MAPPVTALSWPLRSDAAARPVALAGIVLRAASSVLAVALMGRRSTRQRTGSSHPTWRNTCCSFRLPHRCSPRVIRSTSPAISCESRRGAQPTVLTLTMAAAVQVTVLMGWHVPTAFEAAIRHDALHALEHGTLLLTSFVLWSQLMKQRVLSEVRASSCCS